MDALKKIPSFKMPNLGKLGVGKWILLLSILAFVLLVLLLVVCCAFLLSPAYVLYYAIKLHHRRKMKLIEVNYILSKQKRLT